MSWPGFPNAQAEESWRIFKRKTRWWTSTRPGR